MSQQLEEALIEALDLLEQGTPVVKILSRYPDLAGQLRPYLMTALDLNHLAKSSPTAAQAVSKSEFLGYAAAMQIKQPKSAVARLREIMVSSLVVLFILFFAGVVMAVSASESIPGDPLYDTKLFMEQIRLNYSANSEAAAALLNALHQERLDEVNALLSLGRQEIVTFSGVVEEVVEDRWIVEGIPVVITSTTVIHDKVEVGFLVQITGKTSSNIVLVEQVEVMDERPPDSDLTDPHSQEDPSATPLPTIEPLKIPERPELILPDDGSITPSPPIEPVSTGTSEDYLPRDEDAGYENEGDRLESQLPEADGGQEEREDGADESSAGEQEESGDREREEDQNDGSSEDSGRSEEDKDEKNSDREDDADEKEKDEKIEGDRKDEVKEVQKYASNSDDPAHEDRDP